VSKQSRDDLYFVWAVIMFIVFFVVTYYTLINMLRQPVP